MQKSNIKENVNQALSVITTNGFRIKASLTLKKMAEQQLFVNDIPMPFFGQEPHNQENLHSIEQPTPESRQVLRLSQDTVPLDDIQINRELQVSTKVEAKDLNNTNDETNVESPTTGESFVHKCVFCERVLTASDLPKLLECLHNACGSCINNKLYEQSESHMNKGMINNNNDNHFCGAENSRVF